MTSKLILLRSSLLAAGLAALMAIVAAPPAAHAAVCTSTTNGNWSSVTWSGCTPGAGDDVVIDSNVTLDGNVTVRGITINSGRTFNNGASTLTAAAGYLTNNGTYDGGTGTYAFTAAGGVYGSSITAFNNVTIAAGVDFQGGASPAVVNGSLTINSGGFVVTGKAPSYASGSTLRYSSGGSYTAGEEWYPNTTSGPGVPHHVEITSGTTLTFGSSAFARTARGNVTIAGTLTLSSAAGGNLNLGGNWALNGGTFNHNSRTVTFNGSSAQTIGGSTPATFQDLTIDNAAGVTLGQFQTVRGLFTLANGNFSLGGNVLTLNSAGGGIAASGARTITGPGFGGAGISIFGDKTMSGGPLTFASNASLSIYANVDFGASVSTINGFLSIFDGGAVINNPPTYGSSAGLSYRKTGTYNRGLEWSAASGAGYPNSVSVTGGTLNYDSGNPAADRMRGSLQINSSGGFDMGSIASPLTVDGPVAIFGTLSLSNAPGGDLRVGGSWQNQGTFNHNGRTVVFNGSGVQEVFGSPGTVDTTFAGLTIINTGLDTWGVQLGRNMIVNGALTLTDGMLHVKSANLLLGPSAAVSGGSAASMVVTDDNGTAADDGFVCKRYDATGSFTFPVGEISGGTDYSPATLDFTSGAFSAGQACVRVTDAKQPDNTSTTNYLTRYWTATQSGISSFAANTTFNYVDADIVGAENLIYTGQWDGANWTLLNPANTAANTIGGVVSSFSDFTGAQLNALAVTLASFDAQGQADRVVVSWETVSELENAGFNVYRTGSVGDRPEPSDLLVYVASQAPGSTQGAAYSYEDAAVQAGDTYWYWLEDIDLAGATTLHGPVSATVQTPTAVTLNNLNASAGTTVAGLPLLLAAAGVGLALGLGRLRRRAAS